MAIRKDVRPRGATATARGRTPRGRAAAPSRSAAQTAALVRTLLATLERTGTATNRDGMARYGIVSPKMFGVSVKELHVMARPHRRDHALAGALWKSGWYEARMLACFVDDPAHVTPAQMDAWCRDFDNWALCDTACFHLFDRTPHAFGRIRAWSGRRAEFEKRAAFALIAGVAQHDRAMPDEPFVKCLPLIERAADDERNFVKKGVSWALRGVGQRSAGLHAAATELAAQLAESESKAARWVGRDALRELKRKPARERG